MYEKEFCSISDIPEKKTSAPKQYKNKYSSKWYRVIKELLDSEAECIKITPLDITPRNASIGLAGYIRSHDYPVKYCQRGESIYIYKAAASQNLQGS